MSNDSRFTRWLNLPQVQSMLDLIKVLASLATVATVLVTYYRFEESLAFQRETYAIQYYDSYVNFYEKNMIFEKDSITSDSTKWTDLYQNYAHRILFVSESIVNLKRGNPEWENTVTRMLTPHLKYYEKTRAVGTNFSERFREFYKNVVTTSMR